MQKDTIRDNRHAEIALAIKAAKRKMFKASREGVNLRKAATRFITNVAESFHDIVPDFEPAEYERIELESPDDDLLVAVPRRERPRTPLTNEQIDQLVKKACLCDGGEKHAEALLILFDEIERNEHPDDAAYVAKRTAFSLCGERVVAAEVELLRGEFEEGASHGAN